MNTQRINNAVVLAAGLGTRMRPLTDTVPKPLVPVRGKALLDYALDGLEEAGVKRVAINVHYLPNQIEDHVSRRSAPEILVSDERETLLDSGGGVKKAIGSFDDEPFFILNADSFWIDGSQPNLVAMNAAWDGRKMDMLLLVCAKDRAVGFDGKGDFFISPEGRLTRRGEADNAPAVYAGAIIAKKQAFDKITEQKFSLNQMFDEAIADGRLYGQMLDGLWLHVGTPTSITDAEQAIAAFEQTRA